MQLVDLADYNATLLQTNSFKDYCPNGLQVEGCKEVKRIATAVTASLEVIEAAVVWKADALLVHHGYFWRGENPTITGIKMRRIAKLLTCNLSLLAYHLPLDAHESLGNNARLGAVLKIPTTRRFGEQNLINFGVMPKALSVQKLATRVELGLYRSPQVVMGDGRVIKRVAWCSGGAQGYFEEAIAQGADAYITGEVSEQNFHLAQESGIAFIAAGHHATEQFGIQALGEHLAGKFGLKHRFFNQSNPI